MEASNIAQITTICGEEYPGAPPAQQPVEEGQGQAVPPAATQMNLMQTCRPCPAQAKKPISVRDSDYNLQPQPGREC